MLTHGSEVVDLTALGAGSGSPGAPSASPVQAVSATPTDAVAVEPLATVPAEVAPPAPAHHFRRPRFGPVQAGLVLVDTGAAAIAAATGMLVRYGAATAEPHGIARWLPAVLLPPIWVALVAGCRAYERRFFGVGIAEFERVFRAFLHLAMLLIVVSYALKLDISRGFVVTALPLTLAFDYVGRYAMRRHVQRQRAAGRALTSVLAIGDPGGIARFATHLARDHVAGMRVVGACVPAEFRGDPDAERVLAEVGVRICGDVDSVRESVSACSASTVAMLSGAVSAEKLRWVSWQLEGTDTDLIVAPGLTEVAGRRLHVQPVAGLPLLYVDEPQFHGLRRVLKGMFDRILAGMALLVLAPLLLTVAFLVRITSNGPAFFLQTRIGKDGRPFRMVKFRSMQVDAEAQLELLREHSDHGDGVLFKMRHDPRVTAVGRWLRRFSLDELPQLFNILGGSMSLVGPRPPLPSEVARYEGDVRRRLLVKPGLTGLWQVSGRSDLPWEEAVRLDLRYVEDWSLALDALILWKTLRAVFGGEGAY